MRRPSFWGRPIWSSSAAWAPFLHRHPGRRAVGWVLVDSPAAGCQVRPIRVSTALLKFLRFYLLVQDRRRTTAHFLNVGTRRPGTELRLGSPGPLGVRADPLLGKPTRLLARKKTL